MLAGKNILISGASSGIGKQIALDVSLNRGNSFLTGRDAFRLNEVVESISDMDGTASSFIADLRNEIELDNLVNSLPSLSGIVLNAGIVDYTPIKYLSKEKVFDILSVNFVSNVLLINKLLESRKIQQSASIVFISSISAHLGVPGTSIYSASKAALTAFAKVLASELSNRKIRVNIISPGLVSTNLTNKILDVKNSNEDEIRNYPLGLGTTNNISDHVLHLLSDKSQWMTGTDIIIDGGYTLK